jgi:hypothetical protein
LSTANILTLIGIFLTFASVTFAGSELRRSRHTSQSGFLFNISTWYLDDPALRQFFYKLDYNTWKFDEKKFSGSAEEPPLDKMLFVFDLLEHLIESRQMSPAYLQMFAFEASRVLHNPEVKKYLTWLDKEYSQVGVPGPAYALARKLGDRLLTTGIAEDTEGNFTADRDHQ